MITHVPNDNGAGLYGGWPRFRKAIYPIVFIYIYAGGWPRDTEKPAITADRSGVTAAEFCQFNLCPELNLIEQTRNYGIRTTFAFLAHEVGEFLQTVLWNSAQTAAGGTEAPSALAIVDMPLSDKK